MKALTVDQQIAAFGVALPAFVALCLLVGWVWSVRSIAVNARDDLAALIAERNNDKLAWGARLSEAEKTHAAMDRLSDAVKAGAQLTTLQIKTLADKMSDHANATKDQLAEIRQEQKAVRQALSLRSEAVK